MSNFAKGDWVVFETDPKPLQLVTEPYEVSVYYEARPIGSYQALVADTHTGEQIQLNFAKPATEQDFLRWVMSLKKKVAEAEATLDEARKLHNSFLIKKHNLDIND